MSSEGVLSVRLSVANGAVVDVGVVSTRPARAARVLAGRDEAEVLRVVPLLFPVCGMAQAVACARAIDRARGVGPDPLREAARELACLAEAVTSHVWQLAISWKEAAQVPSDVATVRAARASLVVLTLALFEGGVVSAPLRSAPAWAEARAAVVGLVARLEALCDGDDPLLHAVMEASRASFGAADTHPVPALDVEAVGRLLASDPAFGERPELAGGPVDVSAWARQRGDARARDAEAEHGPGLLARLHARRAAALADAHRLHERLALLERGPAGASSSVSSVSPVSPVPSASPTGTGVGGADTARGPLVYWVRASPSLVEDVRVVAPTDWTFHPSGALRATLLGADAGLSLARDAGWMVLALDPCVPWTIEVRDA